MKFIPHKYQEKAINMIIDNPYCGLFLDMGLGKTVSTLTAINILIYGDLSVDKVLVIAPKNVAENTWSSEIEKWDHLKKLTISKVLGNEKQRKEALNKKADIYIINRENVSWLIGFYGGSYFPFDMLVIDELSSFKSPKAQRFKSLRMIRPLIKRVVGLTGTPAPNGLIDLWSQMYLIDKGERLGKNITSYRREYFVPNRTNGMIVFDYKLKAKSCENLIKNKISDICVSMKAEDYLTLPSCIYRNVEVCLDDKLMKEYKDFEREQVLKLFEDDTTITAVNKAATVNKLLQYSNGAVYDEDKNYHIIHNEKLKALEDIIDTSNGNNVLVFYNFKSDLERIKERLKIYNPTVLKGEKEVINWNKGNIQVLLAHPASAGHGLNLQSGGNIIVWFGLTWSLELYLQANARLYRQGQTKPVIIHHIITKSTYDEDVIKALKNKNETQEELLKALKARRDYYLNNFK
jgi:SNF2 family DNA or RNA helicase